MPLTPAQNTAFKAAIAANATTIPAGQPWTGTFSGVAINVIPNTSDGNTAIAGWYSLTASPAYLAWNTLCSVKSIRAAADISKFTPTDNPPATGSTVQISNDMMLYQNRALGAQLKQANAFFLLQGDVLVDCSPQAFRLLFNDCLTGLLTGASGASQNAGWGASATPGNVRLAMQRTINNIEKLFAVASANSGNAGNVNTDPRGSTTNPDTLVYVNSVSAQDVNTARNS